MSNTDQSSQSNSDNKQERPELIPPMAKEIQTQTESFEVSSEEDQYLELEDEADMVQVSKEFEEAVLKFTLYDDLIRKKSEEITELKKKRDPCKKFILEYLEKLGETTIEINGGKLRRNKFETKQPLTNDLIKQSIDKEVHDPQTSSKIMKHMDQSRPIKERIDIKRTFERPKRVRKRHPKKE